MSPESQARCTGVLFCFVFVSSRGGVGSPMGGGGDSVPLESGAAVERGATAPELLDSCGVRRLALLLLLLRMGVKAPGAAPPRGPPTAESPRWWRRWQRLRWAGRRGQWRAVSRWRGQRLAAGMARREHAAHRDCTACTARHPARSKALARLRACQAFRPHNPNPTGWAPALPPRPQPLWPTLVHGALDQVGQVLGDSAKAGGGLDGLLHALGGGAGVAPHLALAHQVAAGVALEGRREGRAAGSRRTVRQAAVTNWREV